MSNTIHKQTVIDMIERDVENKYAFVRQKSTEVLNSLSESVPLLKIALPSVEKWISGKEKQYLPKVQDMVNASIELSFVEPDVSIDDAYEHAKELFNNTVDELIRSKSSFSLDIVDNILQTIIGAKLSL